MKPDHPPLRPLTAHELDVVRRIHEQFGISPTVTRRRIRAGWPEGRLHEQTITDPKRNARTRRYTPACRPKPDHPMRRWRGPKELKR